MFEGESLLGKKEDVVEGGGSFMAVAGWLSDAVERGLTLAWLLLLLLLLLKGVIDERRRMAVPLEPRPRILGEEGHVRAQAPTKCSIIAKQKSKKNGSGWVGNKAHQGSIDEGRVGGGRGRG